ncbi:metal-dependent transcriptional regulator [Flavobacteriales bacterium]|nr:metal-dependent transcriptional regulator [Flavobacteriales bacterium]
MRTSSEEDYLKAIYALSNTNTGASTNALANHLNMKASSITDMLKKLSDKGWVNYEKYKGATLNMDGKIIALSIVRKHRLWETFLVNKLNFKWDEVHEIAEQLEHIKSNELVDRLDDFLGNPKFDPHGDPIPNKDHEITDSRKRSYLSEVEINRDVIIIGVKDSSAQLLQYLEKENMILGKNIIVLEIHDFDKSLRISINGKELNISERVAQNVLVQTN